MKNLYCTLGAALVALVVGVGSAHASVVVGGTRVVLPAQPGEVTVRLTNDSDHPALVEAWVDTGDLNSTPDNASSPFLITPPLFRMDSHKDQSLRIIYTQGAQPLAGDRESLFWLNVLEVPPKPTSLEFQGKNSMQLAIRSRLKLFYRPAGLTGDPLKASAELSFKATSGAGSAALIVHNPTPYYVTISDITVIVGGTAHKVDTGMVAPLSDLSLPVSDLKLAPAAGSVVNYNCINDFGADMPQKGAVSS